MEPIPSTRKFHAAPNTLNCSLSGRGDGRMGGAGGAPRVRGRSRDHPRGCSGTHGGGPATSRARRRASRGPPARRPNRRGSNGRSEGRGERLAPSGRDGRTPARTRAAGLTTGPRRPGVRPSRRRSRQRERSPPPVRHRRGRRHLAAARPGGPTLPLGGDDVPGCALPPGRRACRSRRQHAAARKGHPEGRSSKSDPGGDAGGWPARRTSPGRGSARSGAQLVTALEPPRLDHRSTAPRRHPGPKPVRAHPLALLGLKGSLHP